MLRPACFLPAARLMPLGGFLTPRSGTEVSLHNLGSASRRTDAYRDGTLTHWTGTACGSAAFPFRVQSSLCFVTHHYADLQSATWTNCLPLLRSGWARKLNTACVGVG
jgi:hypothetical protein